MGKAYPSYLVGQNSPSLRRLAHKALAIIAQDDVSRVALSIEREPDNPIDANSLAIRTFEGDFKLGYLPSKHSWISDAIDEGKEISVTITKIKRKGWFRRRYYVDLSVEAY